MVLILRKNISISFFGCDFLGRLNIVREKHWVGDEMDFQFYNISNVQALHYVVFTHGGLVLDDGRSNHPANCIVQKPDFINSIFFYLDKFYKVAAFIQPKQLQVFVCG